MDEMCVKARKFLRGTGRPASSDDMIRKGLLRRGYLVCITNISILNAIRIAVIELISYEKNPQRVSLFGTCCSFSKY
jgi:hypothetical protein